MKGRWRPANSEHTETEQVVGQTEGGGRSLTSATGGRTRGTRGAGAREGLRADFFRSPESRPIYWPPNALTHPAGDGGITIRTNRLPGLLRHHPSMLSPLADSQSADQHQTPPLIDISTPESLERDFYAWLKGELKGKRPFSSHYSSVCASSQTPCAMFLTPLGNVKHEFVGADLSGTSVFQIENASSDLCGSTAFPPMISVTGNNNSFLMTPQMMMMPSFSTLTKEDQMPHLLSSAGQSPSGSSQDSSLEGSPLQQHCLQGPAPPLEIQCFGNSECCNRMVLTEISGIKSDPLNKMGPADAAMMAPNSPGNRSSGTNQLGRTYSPGLPLSMAERQKIVQLFQEGWKICDISNCVSKILQRFRATGSVRPKDAKEGRQESPLVTAIRDYRMRLGIMRQSEMREQLIRDGLCRRDNAPSRSSINHILRTKLSGLEATGKKKSQQMATVIERRNAETSRGKGGDTTAE
uniref:Paired domain-containing protein n=1 Tax=Globodera pallida TaxID=36090 RepID=A0A183CE79_GLOPA